MEVGGVQFKIRGVTSVHYQARNRNVAVLAFKSKSVL